MVEISEAIEMLDEIKATIDSTLCEEMDELSDLHEKLSELTDMASDKYDGLDAFDIKTEEEAYAAYDEILNECYATEGAPTWADSPSEQMQRNDPTMYRCGFVDWLDGESQEPGRIAPDLLR